MVPQEEWGSGPLRRRNCASNVNQPLPEFSATIRISRMYLKNSCALVQYFSNMMLVKMRNADVHFSLDIQVRNLFLVRRIASLRIFIWPCDLSSANSRADSRKSLDSPGVEGVPTSSHGLTVPWITVSSLWWSATVAMPVDVSIKSFWMFLLSRVGLRPLARAGDTKWWFLSSVECVIWFLMSGNVRCGQIRWKIN